MKLACVCVIAVTVLSSGVANSQERQSQSGDIWKWIPFDASATPKDAQIVKDTQYVSIKIQAAHVSYRSGFLENIKHIVVSSNVAFDVAGQKVENQALNKPWEKSKKSEDHIPVNDLLASLSPATANSMKMKIDFAGVGEDRFKGIFDVLSNNDVKTALNLSPAAIAKTGLVTSILQKFLATPYTSDKPKSILSMSQGFTIYSNRNEPRVDSFNKGYIVVISASQDKTADLSNVTSLAPGDLRFDTDNHILKIKQANGSWKDFTGYSYVVLSVEEDSVRGTDESSPWFMKFSEGVRTTERILTGDDPAKVKKDALALWQDGSTLLSADNNYIEAERKSIRLKALDDIVKDLKKNGAVGQDTDIASIVPGVPSNIAEIVANYDSEVKRANLNGSLTIHVTDSSGKAVPNTPVVLENTNTGKSLSGTSNGEGDVTFASVKPGTYSLRVSHRGFGVTEMKFVLVQPREAKTLGISLE